MWGYLVRSALAQLNGDGINGTVICCQLNKVAPLCAASLIEAMVRATDDGDDE
jgi:hypothetical protein